MRLTTGSFRVHGLLLIMCLIWGISYVFVKLALKEMPASSLVFLRCIVAGIALGAFLKIAGGPAPRISREHLLPLLLAALSGIVGYQLLVSWGLEYTTASVGGVLNSASPVFALILAKIMLEEKLTKEKVIGIAVSIVGVLMVVLRGSGEAELELSNLLGPLLVTAGLFGWALCSVLLKPLVNSYPHVYVSGINILIGAAMLLPIALTLDFSAITSLSWVAWVSVLYLGAASSATGQILYVYGLSKLDASQVAAYQYLIPFVSIAAAAPILGEVITIYLLLGGILIIAGIVIANRSQRKVKLPVDSAVGESTQLVR